MKPFETKSIIPIEGKTSCETIDIVKDECHSLRRHVLNVIDSIEKLYQTTDLKKLEERMSKEEWAIYSMLNNIECDLCL